MRFTSGLVLASLLIPSFAATVADVKTDIATISTDLTNLDNTIKAFANPGGTLAQALAIHTSSMTLNNAVTKTTSDTNTVPAPISETDGRALLDLLEALEPKIDAALTDLSSRHAAFVALPLGGVPALVKSDLATLNTSTTALEAALIAKAPADLLTESNALKTRINAAFAAAIAVFA